MVRLALALTAAALAASGAASASSRPFPRFAEQGCARADFPVGPRTIRAELCRATVDAAAGRAVLVLHGCGGFSTFDRRLATELPRAGISTLYVDFFGLTPPPGSKGFCAGADRPPASRLRLFTIWEDVVDAAASALSRTDGVRRVGVVGWSLGGGLAVRAAADRPRLFQAVVGFSTGARRLDPVGLVALPPMLLLSGGRTDAVPLAATRALFRAARAAGVATELYVYPNGSHEWPGRQGAVGIARATRFLRVHLGP
jgi:dienelactone hydrolase